MEKTNSLLKSILIVDDDSSVRWSLVTYLKDRGYLIFEAESGHQAFSIIQVEAIDLVISDIHMPNGDGLELLRKLRALSLHPPVIFVSGGLDLTDSELKRLGASRFLSKPVAGHELLRAIEIVLDESKNRN